MSEFRTGARPPLVVAGDKAMALDQDSGAVRWTYDNPAGRFQRMHVTTDRVLLLTSDGVLHCLRLEDGAVLGVVRLGGREATMLVVADRTYVYTDQKVFALTMDGKVLWQTEVGFDAHWSLVGIGVPGTETQPDFSRG